MRPNSGGPGHVFWERLDGRSVATSRRTPSIAVSNRDGAEGKCSAHGSTDLQPPGGFSGHPVCRKDGDSRLSTRVLDILNSARAGDTRSSQKRRIPVIFDKAGSRHVRYRRLSPPTARALGPPDSSFLYPLPMHLPVPSFACPTSEPNRIQVPFLLPQFETGALTPETGHGVCDYAAFCRLSDV